MIAVRARVSKSLALRLFLAACLAVTAVAFRPRQVAQAAVTLLYFRAVPGEGRVVLQWATASELDIAGFNLHRSLQRDSGYVKLNGSPIIDPNYDPMIGGNYSYLDSAVQAGVTYWYQLEAVGRSQGDTEFFEPVSAVPLGNAANPTLTATLSPTPSLTPVATGEATLTPTSTPTQTPLPPTLNATQVPLPTNTLDAFKVPTPTLPPPQPTQPPVAVAQAETGTPFLEPGTPTPTWIPYPTITIQFPTVTVSALGAAQPVAPKAFPKSVPLFSAQGLGRLWPFGLLVLLWLILGAWFFLAQRRLQ